MSTYLEQSYKICHTTQAFRYLYPPAKELPMYKDFVAMLSPAQKQKFEELERELDMRSQALHCELFEQGFYAGIRCRKLIELGKLQRHEEFATL